MFDVVDRVLELAAARGARDVEAYAERGVSRRIKVYQGEVEQLVAAQRRGVGVRVFRDGAVGYCSTSDLEPEGLADLVDRAVALAAAADPDPHRLLPRDVGPPASVTPFDARLPEADDADKIDLALTVEAAALEADPRVKTVEDTVYVDGDAEVFLANSAGVRGSYRANQCYTYTYVLAEEDGQVETGVSYAVARALEELDGPACGAEAAARACRLLGARRCPSMRVTVVLDPFVAAAFFGVLSAALSAEAVQKGRSLFAGREGEAVADAGFALFDDGTLPDGLDSAPFDGEGTPRQRTPLIEAGVLQGFLHDAYTARKAGVSSTGNGLRGGYASPPSVRSTNLVVAGLTTPRDEIVAAIDRGVLVTDAVGVHSGANPVSGEFSVGISGVLIEGGRLTTPVREVTLAGDIISMLKGVRALGDDARWVPAGSVFTPSVAIEGMAIGGS
jgi:PmbA protein